MFKRVMLVISFLTASKLKADYVFVLQSCEMFHSDVEKNFSKPENTYILLTREAFKPHIDAHFRKVFRDIIFLNDFSVESLYGIIKVYERPTQEKLRLVTHDEYALEVVAKLRERLCVEGDRLQAVLPFRNKQCLREALHKAGIPQPAYAVFSKAKRGDAFAMKFPCFVKPLDEARCRSILKIETKEAFNAFQDNLKDFKDYIVEEAIEGVLYNCPFVLIQHEIRHLFFLEYAYPCFEFFCKKPLGAIHCTARLPEGLQDFCLNTLKLVEGLNNCVGHIEVFAYEGKYACLEIAVRPPGGLFIDLLEADCGINLEQIHYALQLGDLPTLNPTHDRTSFWLWYPKPKGPVRKAWIDSLHACSPSRFAYNADETKYEGPQFLGDRWAEVSLSSQAPYTDVYAQFERLKTLNMDF